jgi:hypothetical protein
LHEKKEIYIFSLIFLFDWLKVDKKIFFLSWIKFYLFPRKSKIFQKKIKINQKYLQMWNKFFAQCQNQTEEKTKIEQQNFFCLSNRLIKLLAWIGKYQYWYRYQFRYVLEFRFRYRFSILRKQILAILGFWQNCVFYSITNADKNYIYFTLDNNWVKMGLLDLISVEEVDLILILIWLVVFFFFGISEDFETSVTW